MEFTSINIFNLLKWFGVGLFLFVALPNLKKKIKQFKRRKNLATTAQNKKNSSAQRITAAYGRICTESSNRKDLTDGITNLKAFEIIAKYRSGELKPTQVISAFCSRTFTVGFSQLNAVTDDNFDESFSKAEEIENNFDNYSSLELVGVPVSIKDCINQRGFDSTCGVSVCCFKPSIEDGLLVELLRDAGALPFIRSNVPQMLMLAESDNLIFGRTANPWDKTRTSGGSSGGDAALVASHSAPIALGTDIGGSVRIPAAFCGVYSFKPTPQRNTKFSTSNPRIHPQRIIDGISGPITRSVEDIVKMLKSMWVPKLWQKDPSVCPLPFNEKLFRSGSNNTNCKLKIGVILHDNFFQPCETSRRAVLLAKQALDEKGYQTEILDIPPHLNGWNVFKLYSSILGAEGDLKSFVDGLREEQMLPAYSPIMAVYKIPNFLKPLLSWVFQQKGEYRRKMILNNLKKGGLSVREFNAILTELVKFRKKFQEFMLQNKVDALLLPAAPIPAPHHGTTGNLSFSFTYFFLANLLEYPAGTIPVTSVEENEQTYDLQTLPKDQRDSTAREIQKVMVNSKGLPISVQVMTLKYNDEVCLHIMQSLEEVFGDLTRFLKS